MNLKLKKADFLMAKRLKQAARQHKDRLGCMWSIAGLFDFRHGRITKRLLSDHAAYMTESTTGSLYPASEGNSLTDPDETRQQIESPNNEKNETAQTRVKELMEEEMQCDQAGDLEDLIDHQLSSKKTAQYHELEDFVNKLLIHQEKNVEEEKPKPLERSNSVDNKRSNPVSEEHVNRKPRNFFKRRTKSHECISLNDTVITPPSTTPNSFHHEKKSSHFSFTEIKKKLKNAITISPRHSGCRETPIVEGNTGWSSPTRDHFYSERFYRFSNGSKRQDAVSRLSKSERKTGETLDFGETSERVSNIYFEAKKHLSEMLNNENEHTELTVEDHSRSLGKLLAFQGYSSLSSGISPQNEPVVNESQPSVTYAEDQKPEILEEVHQDEDVVDIVKPPSPEENEVTDVPAMKNFQDFGEEDELSCSPIASPSGSSLVINRQSEEVESTSDDKTGKPSPISVLEPMFSDDEISPARTISRSGESSLQPLRIRFEDTVTRSKSQETCSLNSVENEESIFEYIEAVLLASDLNWDEFEKRWLSSDQILDPSLYDELQIFSSRPADDQQLLFDTTNEILEEICDRSFDLFPELSCLKRHIHPLPKGMDLINEVCDRIESRLNCRDSISLDELVERDLELSKKFMDLRPETQEMVIEIEERIFEDLIEDTVLSLMQG